MVEALTPSTDAPTRSEWRDGWTVLLASTLGSGVGFAFFQTTAGLFIRPMQDELGWSTSSLAIAPMVLLAGALLLPLAGPIVQRWRPRRVAITGISLSALLYLLFAGMPAERATFFALGGAVALLSPLAYYGPFLQVVSGWFRRNTGIAVGISMNGLTISTIIALPTVSYVIEHWGWRAGYLTLSGLVLLLGLPVVAVFLREAPPAPDAPAARTGTPTDEQRIDDRNLRQAMRDRRFWLLLASFISATLALGGYVAHLQPMLRHIGLGAQQAAMIGVVMMISIGFGRLASGYLLDRFWPYAVAVLCLMPPIVGALYMAGIDGGSPIVWLAAAVAFIGLAHGAEADFLAYFTIKLFGTRYFTTIFGVFSMISLIGSALGGIFFSFIFDRFGSYSIGCYVGAGLFVQSAALLLIAGLVDRKALFARRAGRAVEPLPVLAKD